MTKRNASPLTRHAMEALLLAQARTRRRGPRFLARRWPMPLDLVLATSLVAAAIFVLTLRATGAF